MEAGSLAVAGVVLEQPPPHVAGRDSDNCIFTRVIRRRTMKELHADGSLFELIDGAVEDLLDDVAEKLLAAMASAESNSRCKFLNVRPERLYLHWVVEYSVEVAGAEQIVDARSHWLTGLYHGGTASSSGRSLEKANHLSGAAVRIFCTAASLTLRW